MVRRSGITHIQPLALRWSRIFPGKNCKCFPTVPQVTDSVPRCPSRRIYEHAHGHTLKLIPPSPGLAARGLAAQVKHFRWEFDLPRTGTKRSTLRGRRLRPPCEDGTEVVDNFKEILFR